MKVKRKLRYLQMVLAAAILGLVVGVWGVAASPAVAAESIRLQLKPPSGQVIRLKVRQRPELSRSAAS